MLSDLGSQVTPGRRSSRGSPARDVLVDQTEYEGLRQPELNTTGDVYVLGAVKTGGRLGWLIASAVVVAALQRAVDVAGPLFLLKAERSCSTVLALVHAQPPTLTASSAVT